MPSATTRPPRSRTTALALAAVAALVAVPAASGSTVDEVVAELEGVGVVYGAYASSDGSRVLVRGRGSGGPAIVSVDVASGAVARVSPRGQFVTVTAQSASGDVVAWSTDDARPTLYVRQLGRSASPRSLRFPPGYRRNREVAHIALAANGRVYALMVPRASLGLVRTHYALLTAAPGSARLRQVADPTLRGFPPGYSADWDVSPNGRVVAICRSRGVRDAMSVIRLGDRPVVRSRRVTNLRPSYLSSCSVSDTGAAVAAGSFRTRWSAPPYRGFTIGAAKRRLALGRFGTLLSIGPDGRSLIAADNDKRRLALISLRSGRLTRLGTLPRGSYDFVTWARGSNRAVIENGRGGLALIDLQRQSLRTLATPRLAFPKPCFTATGRLLIRADARGGADAAVLYVSDRRLSGFSRVAPSGPLRPFYAATQCDGIASGGVPQIWLVGGGVVYSSPVERLDGTPLMAAPGPTSMTGDR